jgi:hypothetical protein
MGRSVSYPSDAVVVTFADNSDEQCSACEGAGTVECGQCEGTGETDAMGETEDCPVCNGEGFIPCDECDGTGWIGREDHVLAENRLARFGMSEYCGLVAYWIVPQKQLGGDNQHDFSETWIKSIADKFVAAFGELTKVGSMSNGEGVYRRIDK